MDDVFDEGGDETEISRREWKKMQESRVKEGYKEGLSAGEESKLQQGFDDGAILVKQHQDNPEVTEDTPLAEKAKKLIDEISALETELFKEIQKPLTPVDLSLKTGFPGPGFPGPSQTSCACAADSKDSDSSGDKKSSDKDKENCGSCLGSTTISASVIAEFSKEIERMKAEVVLLLKGLKFSDAFIATL